MKLSSLGSNLSVCTLVFDCNRPCGTGFLVEYKDRRYILTDYHVVYHPDQNHDWILNGNSLICSFRNQELSIDATYTIEIDLHKIEPIGDKDMDLLLYEIKDGEGINICNNSRMELTPFVLDRDREWNQESVCTKKIGDILFTYGFPTAIKLEVPFGDKPILSQGIISSISIDNFLIDIPSIYGNSGSVVLYKSENGELSVVGIVQRLIPFNLEWYNSFEKNLRRMDWHNSGYTICKSIESVRVLIDNDRTAQ